MARQMKDSGIAWIGEIPDNWDVSLLKYSIRWKSEKGQPDATVLSLYRDYGIVPKDSRDDNHNVTSLDTSGYKVVDVGDFVINKMKAWQGSMGVSGYRGIVSPAYHVCEITNPEINKQYFHHLLRNPAYLPEYMRLSTGMRIGQWDLGFDDFKNIPFIIPPTDEQKKIVSYIDRRCAEIDAAMERTKATIEEYKKLKQAVITEAVTKGVRGARKMKDSGIEWIGEIPEEWSRIKTLYALSMPITDGPHETPELFDTGVPFVSAEAVSCGKGSIDFNHIRGFISEEYYQECCKKYIPQINDILMIKSGATTGRVSVVDTDIKFTIWSPLAVFRCNADIFDYRYLFFFLQSDGYQKQIENKWTFGTQQNIGMRTLEQLIVCYPPLDEQREIAVYLDEKCAALDTLIAKKTALLIELETYKKSLIYEYVTGKKEVG